MHTDGDYISRSAAIKRFTFATLDCLGMEPTICASDVVLALQSIPAADVRPVVTCADCKWWTKQESSLQGRCELLQMYPTGAWFCANGKREES